MSSGFSLLALVALVVLWGLPGCSAPNPSYAQMGGADAARQDAADEARGSDAPLDVLAPVDTLEPDLPQPDLAWEAPAAEVPADGPAEPSPDLMAPPVDGMPAEAPIADSQSWEAGVGQDLLTGLIGYWRMDEPAGSLMARDSSGLNHHGVLESVNGSAVWVTTGRFGSALDITDDDKNAGVRIESTARIAGIQKYTVAAWARRLRLRPTAYQSIISRQRGQGTAEVFDMSVSLDKLIAYAPDRTSGGATSAIVPTAAPVLTWFHAAASFDGTTIRIYQDGVLRDSTAWVGTLPASDRPLYLGTNKNESGLSNAHHPWEGQLDEILLYDRALPDEAIKVLAQGERPPLP